MPGSRKSNLAHRSLNSLKRREPSHVDSETPEQRVASDFVAKRIKREHSPAGDLLQSPSLAQEPHAPATSGGDVDEAGGRQIDQDAQSSSGSARVEIAGHGEPAGDYLRVLANSNSTSKKLFRGAVDDLLDDAFTLMPDGVPSPPGLAFIANVERALQTMNAPVDRITEVMTILRRSWRLRMARYLGDAISSPDELYEVTEALVAVSSPKRDLASFRKDPAPSFGGFAHHQSSAGGTEAIASFQNAGLFARSKAPSPQNGVQQGPASLAIPVESSNEALEVGGRPEAQPPSIENPNKVSHSPDRCSIQLEFTNETKGPLPTPRQTQRQIQRQTTDRETLMRETFKETFDTFLHHVRLHRKCIEGHRQINPEEGEAFRQRARSLYKNTLSSEERKEWRKLHKELLEGDTQKLHESSSENIFTTQLIALKLDIGQKPARAAPRAENHLRPCRLSPSGPLFVRFMNRKHCQTSKRVMFVLDAPHCCQRNFTREDLRRTLAHESSPEPCLDVEEWRHNIWVAVFDTAHSAKANIGVTVLMPGATLTGEAIRPRPPSNFICDLSDAPVSSAEVAHQISQAFRSRKETPSLHIQEAPKLYHGTQYTVEFKQSSQCFRFYIPLRKDLGAGEILEACFRPLDPMTECALCRHVHGSHSCQHSRPVALPKDGVN